MVKLRNYSPGEMEKLILEKTRREKHQRTDRGEKGIVISGTGPNRI